MKTTPLDWRDSEATHRSLYHHSIHFLIGCSGDQGSRDTCAQVGTLGLSLGLTLGRLVAWKLARAI